jgi:hypothetical protein
LQEEALAASKRLYRRYDHAPAAKPIWPGALAHPPPPPKNVDADMKHYNHNPSSSDEDKFKAL